MLPKSLEDGIELHLTIISCHEINSSCCLHASSPLAASHALLNQGSGDK